MAGWAGFSDEELRKMQQKDQGMHTASSRGRKPATTNRSRQQLQRERALQIAAQQKAGQGLPVLSPEQQLDQPPPQTVKTVNRPAEPVPTPVPLTPEQLPEKLKKETMVSYNAPALVEETPIAKELEKDEVEVREKTRLECLQQEQKLIEERNKRKKALLTKTIAEKSKQTQAETVKLKRIQKEVQALDDMVSNDIGILRGKIEQASWDYNVARKRYEKAEAEYVTAKLDLHKKTDIKEQLTEHLFAIIQQNELRKALKLEELLQQLQLQATEEELERKREEEEQEKKKIVVEINGEGVNADQVASEKDVTPGLEAKTQGLGDAMVHKDDISLLTEPKTSDQDCKILDTSSQELKDLHGGSSPCTS